jgi:hypothetical protein
MINPFHSFHRAQTLNCSLKPITENVADRSTIPSHCTPLPTEANAQLTPNSYAIRSFATDIYTAITPHTRHAHTHATAGGQGAQ